MEIEQETLVTLAADIVSAHVANNSVEVSEVATLISSVYGALSTLGDETTDDAEPIEPAVSVRSSVKKDHLVCLVCGQHQKMLKRHLSTAHDMTPDEYREHFGLKADYPMVAPDYRDRRSELAKKIGLGKKPGQRRGRQKKSA